VSAPRILALALLALAAASTARAERPAGDYTIAVDDPQIFVPVLSEPNAPGPLGCATEQGVTLCVDRTVSFFPMTNTSGGFAASVLGHVGGHLTPLLDLSGSIGGLVSGPPRKRTATFTLTLAGNVLYAGAPVLATMSGKGRCAAPATNPGPMACLARTNLCVTESRRVLGCVEHDLELSLPQEGGAWELRLVNLVTTNREEVTGTARVVLAGGEELLPRYAVNGKYDVRRDSANLALTGGLRTRIKLSRVELEAGAARAGTMTFRIANQRGRVDLGPEEEP
jgi:hypothetical protein